MERLEALQLVSEVGQRSGTPGRSASLYELRTDAALVLGVDIGGSNVRVALSDARGRLLAEARQATTASGGPEVVKQTVALVRALREGADCAGTALTVAGLSVPGVLAADSSTVHYAWNIGQPEPYDFRTPLEAGLRVPVVLDNNVNLAALGEQWQGAAQLLQTFAVIAVGAGVGAGIVHDGQLLRGARRCRRGCLLAVVSRLQKPLSRFPRRGWRLHAPAPCPGSTGLARRHPANQC